MFQSKALIDLEILAERVRSEVALLERRRARLAGAVEVPRQSADATNPIAAIIGPPPTAEAAPVEAPGRDRRGGIKEFIKSVPVVSNLARGLWKRGQSIAAGFLALLIEPRRSEPSSEPPAQSSNSGKRRILFVGTWQEDNAQIDLVRAFGALRLICEAPVQLILAGKCGSARYCDDVKAEIHNQQLDDHVVVLKDPSQQELDRLYRCANLYLSLAVREPFFAVIGSGPPLVRAMAHDVPVVTFPAGAISAVLGANGLVLLTRESDVVASIAKLVLEEPWLRRQIVHAQQRVFHRLQDLSIRAKLRALATLGQRTAGNVDTTAAWRIEGPFDSAYSLAIVNREVALALSRQGEAVGLVSRDGPGAFSPSVDFLQENPTIAELWKAGEIRGTPGVALRNTYPPWVSDMAGEVRGIVCYAWDESGFPENYVQEFNCNLDVATVTSRYVGKVLRDNGVRTPIRVIGDGVDQITRRDDAHQDEATEQSIVQQYGIGERFCFLHISSCLPRKAPDVLLAAWARAFRDSDDVVLVIKTSPNQHHQIEADVVALTAADPHHAPIVVVNRSVDDAHIYALYRRADVVVAPSRGEGFGLPVAEAMALTKPVITTAFGGQMDFCSDQSAWLCDYDFAYARSHLSTPLSVWAEPRLDSLIDCLRNAHEASASERLRRGEIGRAKVRGNFAWTDVAARLQSAVADVRSLDTDALQLPKVGWVSTWNSRCGIAAYSDALTSAIPPDRLVVFANYNAELLGPDALFVKRTWEQGWRDPLDQLYDAIVDAGVDAVVIQFNFGFQSLKALARLIDRLSEKAIAVYLGLHATTDIERPDVTIRLAEATDSLRRVRRVFVHSVHDLNRLKARGLIDNIMLLPFGLPQPPVKNEIRAEGSAKLVATFGYLLAHKGLPELIDAIAMLRRDGLDVDLLLLNALYPGEESQRMRTVCEKAIADHGLSAHVTLRTEYLEEADIVRALAAADLVVFPYQQTQESASAAVRLGLASLTPVATTPLPIFDDVASITHRLPGPTAVDLASGMKRLLGDPFALSRLSEQQQAWVAGRQWQSVSRRLYDLIRGEFVDDQSGSRGQHAR